MLEWPEEGLSVGYAMPQAIIFVGPLLIETLLLKYIVKSGGVCEIKSEQ